MSNSFRSYWAQERAQRRDAKKIFKRGFRLDRRQNTGAGRKTYEQTVLCISAKTVYTKPS